MNFYETLIKAYDRRIKRIEENPDPKLLRSTKLLYEVERESYINRLQAWREGKPFAEGVGCFRPLLLAMGFSVSDTARDAMRVTSESASRFDTLRAAGLPDDACDVTAVPLAMYLKGDVPLPALVVPDSSVCDSMAHTKKALAHMFNIPSFCIDTKVVPTYDSIRYCADQLGELIEFAESKVPGIKYDEDKLIELQELDRQAYTCMHDIYEARKRIPCPIAGKDAFRNPPVPSTFTNQRKALEWCRVYRDELVDKADKGIGAVADEKLRFLWTVSGPYYANPFEYLEKRGVSVPMCIMGNAGRKYHLPRWGSYGDEKEFGRRLTPLEEEARMANTTWGLLGRFWVDDIIYVCKDLKIDGIVNFEQVGCTATLGLARSVADAAEKELGIPTLHLEGRNIDVGSYNQQQFEARLGELVDICLARKGFA